MTRACQGAEIEFPSGRKAADEIGQDFLLAYQRAVLLALQQQGVLNETQFKDCVQKLEKYTRMNGGNE